MRTFRRWSILALGWLIVVAGILLISILASVAIKESNPEAAQ